jgi:uncharacterized membrane protein
VLFRILFAVLILGFTVGAVGTLLRVKFFQEIMDLVGVGRRLGVIIAILEICAAAGLAVGLFVPALGIAAAAGLALLMCGAITFHVRAKDFKGVMPPAMNLVLALAAVAVALPHV